MVMSRQQHTLIYHTHRTMGACVALILFAVCLSGTLTVLRSEIEVWSINELIRQEKNARPLFEPHDPPSTKPSTPPPKSQNTTPISIDEAIATFGVHHSLTQSSQWAIFLPTEQLRAYKLLIFEKNSPQKKQRLTHAYLHADTGKYLGVPARELSDFIFQFHGNFSIQTKIGRYLVGLFGLCFLVMIGTGLILHRHLIRDLFKLRWTGSRRRLFADAHKFAGTWFLAFHLLIGTTGTIIALKDLLLLAPAFTVYRGDLKHAKRELRTRPPIRSGTSVKMHSVESMLHTARTSLANFSPTLVTVQVWGDQAAEIAVSGSLRNELLGKNEAASLHFSGANNQMLRRKDGREEGLWQRSFCAITPLHYGDFGGLPVKLTYLFGGITTLLLIWSGLWIWLEQQSAKRFGIRQRSPQ